MISPDTIRKQAERAYPDFLRSLVTGEPFFPFDIRFGKRVPKGNYHAFARKRDVLLAASDSSKNAGNTAYIVELKEHHSRRYGRQMLPARIYFDRPEGFAAFLGRKDEVRRFHEAVAVTRRTLPELLPWVESRAHRITSYLDRWQDLLAVCRYFLEHPRPDLFARELPLEVHTKFIEEHESLLGQMLDFLLPQEAVRREAPDFAGRYGLRHDEPTVRIRVLDTGLPTCSGWPSNDLSLPLSAAAALDFSGSTVVITENKMTFLTLPHVKRGLALWGGGFQVDVLREVKWLRGCRVFYWGDLDAHGFMILSRLRSFLPDARSMMMDVETFEAFRWFAVPGTPTDLDALPNLTPREQAVFQSLARSDLRLEQERIPHSYVIGCFVDG